MTLCELSLSERCALLLFDGIQSTRRSVLKTHRLHCLASAVFWELYEDGLLTEENKMSRQRTLEKIMASEYVSTGEPARLTGVRYGTLKYYTEEGMLPFEQEEENLTRRYLRAASVARVEKIRAMRAERLSIPEIKKGLPGPGPGRCPT